LPTTTIRAAAFKVLKRTLITNQTLEPTQVAGFNQFFDDPNGTEAWNYGVAIDQKFSNSLFGGAEYYQRDMKVPVLDLTAAVPTESKVDWNEKLARAYLFWTPHNWISLSAEYAYERDERDQNLNFNVKTLETNRFPLGVNFFHPSGLSAAFKATYYRQQGEFNRLLDPSDVFVNGSDNFWLADAAIGYRLPQRLGIFSIGARNLFNTSFKYFDVNPGNPTIQPDRVFYARVTLSI